MRSLFFNKKTGILFLVISLMVASCTDLDQHLYDVTPISNFFQTPEQIAAGVAPAYQALTGIPDGAVYNLQEVTSDEQVVPTRGGDWDDGGKWRQLWQHNWDASTPPVNDAWNSIYSGIGKINFTLNVLNTISNKPPNIDKINAELKTLRDYYYFLAMDLYGNVPLVTDFNTPPDSVTNTDRKDVYDFIVNDLKSNLDLLPENVDASTYGRVTKWMAFMLLAKLYLGAQVYTGTAAWEDCIAACDSVMKGPYSLEANYFDNFSVDNQGSTENIFVVPYDNINIGGNNREMETLHYQNQINFQLTGGPYNGFCSNVAFYSNFDTTSTYTTEKGNVYRTFNDQRSGQYLIGQQYATPYTYPPNINVLYHADPSLKIQDAGTGLDLDFTPKVAQLSNGAGSFRLAGVRNIKYFPEAGTAGSQSNDIVIFRLADVYLMKAEAELRANKITDALDLVNKVRERAYSGDKSHDWIMKDLTLDNILAERARELAWENWRRDDLIRYEVASGKRYFSAARTPGKSADPDDHLLIFPIPSPQISANPNLKQNPGY